MKKIMALMLFGITLFGCAKQQPPNDKTVIGKYLGRYGTAEETIVLRSDHTFAQELVWNGKLAYRNEGKWRIDGRDVAFDNFFQSVQPGTSDISVPKIGTDNVRGLWVTLNQRAEIVFDVDHNYRITKE